MIQTILNIIEDAKNFPVIITNKDVAIIEESAHIINELENYGYMCVTFSKGDTYGIKVYGGSYEII
jgi:hypothetical protein